MQIHFQDKTYKVSNDLVLDLIDVVLGKAKNFYKAMPEAQQIILDGFARGYLYTMEEKMRAKNVSNEDILKFRPAKNEDATTKVIDVMSQITLSGSEYIDLEFDVEDDIITSLSYGMSLPDELQKKTI